MSLTQAQIESILTKLERGVPLNATDTARAAELVRAIGAALVALDEANQDLQFNLSLCRSADQADAAARSGVLNGLQMLAPPAATVDIEGAMKALKQLRTDVKKGKSIIATAGAAAKFAIQVVGKFV